MTLVLGVGSYASGLLAGWGKLSNGQYSAQYGTVRNLDLVDDSLITLNGGSQVTLDLQTDHRRVTLDRGEAMFRVEKDTSRPFDVKVGSATVRSVGTVFSVRKDTADAAETVVEEGKVLVMGSQSAPFPVDAGQTARLAAVAADGGCHACHSHQSCQEHCPVALNPTASIAGLKRRAVAAYLKGEIEG